MSKATQQITEDDLIDYILKVLYGNLSTNEMHLEREVLQNIQLDARQLEHVHEVLSATGLVNNSIGFGKSGYVYLSQQGIRFMKEYKGYLNFLRQQNRVEAGVPQPQPTDGVKARHGNEGPVNDAGGH